VAEYVEHQRRYARSCVDVATLEEHVCRRWHYLETISRNFPAT
jgi:hypothetical protein